jgi:hypothetical protein
VEPHHQAPPWKLSASHWTRHASRRIAAGARRTRPIRQAPTGVRVSRGVKNTVASCDDPDPDPCTRRPSALERSRRHTLLLRLARGSSSTLTSTTRSSSATCAHRLECPSDDSSLSHKTHRPSRIHRPSGVERRTSSGGFARAAANAFTTPPHAAAKPSTLTLRVTRRAGEALHQLRVRGSTPASALRMQSASPPACSSGPLERLSHTHPAQRACEDEERPPTPPSPPGRASPRMCSGSAPTCEGRGQRSSPSFNRTQTPRTHLPAPRKKTPQKNPLSSKKKKETTHLNPG